MEVDMKDSYFIFDYVDKQYYNCKKIKLNREQAYLESPQWLSNNFQNNDEECLKQAVTVTLHHKEIPNDPERVTNDRLSHFSERY